MLKTPRAGPSSVLLAIILSTSSLLAQKPLTWVGSWATSQQIPEPANAQPAEALTDATLCQIVHLSLGGGTLRVHLSNAFGNSDLHIAEAHIARPLSASSSRIDPASDRALHFSGAPQVLIPPGAEYISDPVDFAAAPLSDLAITIYLDAARKQPTSHPGSRATSYLSHGNQVASPELTDAQKPEHWYFLSGVDVAAPRGAYAVVALGDSITGGRGATTNGNDRWTDVLAGKLQSSPATRNVSVLNQGIGGNHLLTDGLGPNALARLDRDVLAQPGVRALIVLEGINDLGGLARAGDVPASQHEDLVHRMLGAYRQIIDRAHAHGLTVVGATILPDSGSEYYHPSAANEADRQQINQWILTPGHFDATVDLAKLIADPGDPTRLAPALDSGDHLHPSAAGYRIMGEAFPLALFTTQPANAKTPTRTW